MIVHDHEVRGVDIDPATRCTHYDAEFDVIAIRFRCCDTYYPCYRCHDALTDHDPTVWPADAGGNEAVLCGRCGYELTIEEYLASNNACPECGGAFNPACRQHYHHYFADDLIE